MLIEKKDDSLIFTETNISDIFITKYLQNAPGDAVKLYIYLLFQSKFSNNISLKNISNAININYNAVKSAFDYWSSKGVFVKTNSGYIIRSIKEVELFEKYNPKVSLSANELKEKNKEKEKIELIDNINKQFFQGIMSPNWVNKIYSWISKFDLSDEVIFALFQYGKDKNAMHQNYLEQVALTWNQKNIKNYQDLTNYLNRKQVIYRIGKNISQKLRLYRNLTEFEEEYLEKWVFEYKFDEKIINIALKLASDKGVLSFKYLDAILSDWFKNKLKTEKEIEDYVENMKLQFNKKIKSPSQNSENSYKKKVTSKTAHTQREFSNLEELYD